MPDWNSMFVPTVGLTEIMLRATLMYLFLFFALRFLLKREGGEINIADLLVVVAIVDGAQPAFNGDAVSITESAVFVATIIFWSYLLNWLSFRFPSLKWLTTAKPVTLIKDGRFCRPAMRKALMTEEELMQQLREEGVDDVKDVRRAMLEGDGQVSVVTFEGK